MPKSHLRQPRLTYSAYGSLTKNKERIKELKESDNSRYIYQNELDKACFQHNMAYGDFKDLPRRTGAYKVLQDKAFNFSEYLKYDGYQRGLSSMVLIFYIKIPLLRVQIYLQVVELKVKICHTKNCLKNNTN